MPMHAKPWQRPEPPLVEAARNKSPKQRNVWESYLVLDPKTRLYFSLGMMVFAAIGLWAGDYFVPETEEEKDAAASAKLGKIASK
ncbi:hypothetical protein MNV49_000997 [Pseudohyphozyma bogoriensis]|nr:hypothetical protein MNV49_000997 [Pseudohyphozyma bogoriensis]